MVYDVLVIDGNSVAHRAGAVLFLKNDKGENTSVSFGFFNMLRSVIERDNFSEVCVCWDSKGGSVLKKSNYPEYKQNRKKSGLPYDHYMEIVNQIEDIIKVLPAFGLKQLKKDGIEADDIIGILCEELISKNKKVLILSSDQDLFQLVQIGATVYYPIKNIYLTKENFEEIIGIKPDYYIFYQTIIGDSGDNIQGLKSFGKVTAKKLLDKFGAWTEWFAYCGKELGQLSIADGIQDYRIRPEILDCLNSLQKKIISDPSALEILLRNFLLMSVGFLDANNAKEILKDFYEQKPTFNEKLIREYFLEKNFNSFLNRFHGWIHIFRMLTWKKEEIK